MNIFRHRPLAVLCVIYLVTFFVSFFILPLIKAVLITVSILASVVLIIKRNDLCAVCICIILALSYGYFYFDVHVENAEKLAGSKESVTFEVVDITFINDSIAFLDGKLISDNVNNRDLCHFTLSRPGEIEKGDIINVEAEFTSIEQVDGFDAEQYYHSRNIWIEAKAEEPRVIGHNTATVMGVIGAVRNYCVESFENNTEDDTTALLNALSIGDKSGVDESVKRDFGRLGISHMLAISGMHLAVIMGCLMMFTNIFRLNRRIVVTAVSVICVAYIFISGASPSVVRAGIMFLIMSLGTVIRRKSDSLTNLFVTLFLIIVFSPSGIFDVGLILSFTSTVGIIVIVGPFMERRASDREISLIGRIGLLFVTPIMTTLSAMAFSFIPVLIFFDEISMISVISNLCLGPCVTLLLFLLPCFLLVSFLPFLPTVFGVYLDIMADAVYRIVQALSAIPNASVNLNYPFIPYTLIGVAVGIVLIFIIRKRYAYFMPYLCWFLTLGICLAIHNISFGGASDVVFYSDSGSDAVLIRSGASSVYLDVGRGSNAAQKRAFGCIEKELYTKEIDTWIITCYSNEAVHNVRDYLNTYYVRNILIPSPYDDFSKLCAEEIGYYTNGENVNVLYYEYGREFICNENAYTVYSPVTFEDSSVMIPSADIICNGEKISYYGCGYFDYGDVRGECDYLYMGEKGSKRKQANSPHINTGCVVISEGNDTAADNIDSHSEINLNDERNFVKIRIG